MDFSNLRAILANDGSCRTLMEIRRSLNLLYDEVSYILRKASDIQDPDDEDRTLLLSVHDYLLKACIAIEEIDC